MRQTDDRKTEKIDSRETPAKTVGSPYSSVVPETKPYKIDQREETMTNKLSVGGVQPSIPKSQYCNSKLSSDVSNVSKITVDGPCDSDARSTMVNSSQSKYYSNVDPSGKLSQGSVPDSNKSMKTTPPISNPMAQPLHSQEQPTLIGQHPYYSAEDYRQNQQGSTQGSTPNQQGQPGLVPSHSAPGNLQMEQVQAQLANMYPNMVPGTVPVGQIMYPANVQMQPGHMNPGYIPGFMPHTNLDPLQLQALMFQQFQQNLLLMMKAGPNLVMPPADSTPSPVSEESQTPPQIANLFPTIPSSNSRASSNNRKSSGNRASSTKSRDYSSENSSDDSISLTPSLYLQEDGGRMEEPNQRSGPLELPYHPFQPRAKRVAELSANHNPSVAVDESLLPETPQASVVISGLNHGQTSVPPGSGIYSSGYVTGEDMMFQSIRGEDYKDIKLNLSDIPKSPEIQPPLPSKCDSEEVSLTNSSLGGSTFLHSGDMSDRSDSFSDSSEVTGINAKKFVTDEFGSRTDLKSNRGSLNFNVNNNREINSLNGHNSKCARIFRSLPDADLETQV